VGDDRDVAELLDHGGVPAKRVRQYRDFRTLLQTRCGVSQALEDRTYGRYLYLEQWVAKMYSDMA
jgi:hypothetical protein